MSQKLTADVQRVQPVYILLGTYFVEDLLLI